MAALTEAVPIASKWQWPLQDLFGDLRIQYGIKLGLAGLLALYWAQLLRLEHPSWAILTAMVLMGARYVGSITVKAIMRVVGTIGGALLGNGSGSRTDSPEPDLDGPESGSRCANAGSCGSLSCNRRSIRRVWEIGSNLGDSAVLGRLCAVAVQLVRRIPRNEVYEFETPMKASSP